MTTLATDNQIIHFDKKFGLITKNQIIIIDGEKQNKIKIDSIDKVKLIKQRVFYFNTALLLMSLAILSFSYFYFESEKIEMYASLIIFGLLLLIYSLIHKFYLYKIIIKEKDQSTVELKTTQINRESIKEFYYTILKYVPKPNRQ